MSKSRDLLERVRLCAGKNISPEEETFSKGQVRGWLRNKTDFLSLCQLLSAAWTLQNQLLLSKLDTSEHGGASVLVHVGATALPSLPGAETPAEGTA